MPLVSANVTSHSRRLSTVTATQAHYGLTLSRVPYSAEPQCTRHLVSRKHRLLCSNSVSPSHNNQIAVVHYCSDGGSVSRTCTNSLRNNYSGQIDTCNRQWPGVHSCHRSSHGQNTANSANNSNWSLAKAHTTQRSLQLLRLDLRVDNTPHCGN